MRSVDNMATRVTRFCLIRQEDKVTEDPTIQIGKVTMWRFSNLGFDFGLELD